MRRDLHGSENPSTAGLTGHQGRPGRRWFEGWWWWSEEKAGRKKICHVALPEWVFAKPGTFLKRQVPPLVQTRHIDVNVPPLRKMCRVLKRMVTYFRWRCTFVSPSATTRLCNARIGWRSTAIPSDGAALPSYATSRAARSTLTTGCYVNRNPTPQSRRPHQRHTSFITERPAPPGARFNSLKHSLDISDYEANGNQSTLRVKLYSRKNQDAQTQTLQTRSLRLVLIGDPLPKNGLLSQPFTVTLSQLQVKITVLNAVYTPFRSSIFLHETCLNDSKCPSRCKRPFTPGPVLQDSSSTFFNQVIKFILDCY
ncbi:hypothetical protein C8R44DRAFT_724561 [Mycena epipterygia]|nr:hypothetical protein C8R44DRAFT_724561 [Mycena epipterygia]